MFRKSIFYICLFFIFLKFASISQAKINCFYLNSQSQETLESSNFDGEDYILLRDLVRIVQANSEWYPEIQRLKITVGEHSFQLIVDNCFLSIDRQVYQLVNPPRKEEGELLVPVEFLWRYLGPTLKEKILWNDEKKELSFEKASPVVKKNIPSSTKTKLKIEKIVIDAGHGGQDPGAIGPTKFEEKIANLDMALRLKELLEKKLKVKVIMTRVDDTFIPLGERTKIANEAQANLFVSIHCNANRSRAMNGCETYFLSLARNDEARATEILENSALKFEKPDTATGHLSELDFIFGDLIQTEYLAESSELAELVQEEFSKRLPINSRGINQAGFYVLRGAMMPAILVETAFISNWQEERLLRQSKFRAKIVEAIYAGIAEFKKIYEKRMNK
ncbi:MAG: N-acetylmuramoyl-L-alanine amidase [Candidatus Edwardsbacteria bacterium]